jgi:hypothetical protein
MEMFYLVFGKYTPRWSERPARAHAEDQFISILKTFSGKYSNFFPEQEKLYVHERDARASKGFEHWA